MLWGISETYKDITIVDRRISLNKKPHYIRSSLSNISLIRRMETECIGADTQ